MLGILKLRITRVCFAIIVLTLVLVGPAYSIDFFSIVKMARFPITFDGKTNHSKSKLIIERTFDEVYKKWKDGIKTADVSSSRTSVGLELNLLPELTVGASKLFTSSQRLMNKNDANRSLVDLDGDQQSKSIFARLHKNYSCRFENEIELGYGESKNILLGDIILENSLEKTLGGSPKVDLKTKNFTRDFLWKARYKNLLCKTVWSKGLFSESLDLLLPNMGVVIPLEVRSNSFSLEFAWNRQKRLNPFLRYEKNQISGNGENYKNTKFRFGNSNLDFKSKLFALGLHFNGRYPWFIEIQNYDISFNGGIMNNLITLNPLMLFGVNEITQNETIFFEKTMGIRFGGKRKFRGGVCLKWQYHLLDMKAQRLAGQEKISNFRTTMQNNRNEFSYHLRLHRLETTIFKPVSMGQWKLRANITVPEMVSKSENNKNSLVTPTPPTTPGSSQVSKIKTKVRGGWQITISREFYL